MNYDWKQIKKPLLIWYEHNQRDLEWRRTKNPYKIWISEIMLQQTRVEAVKEYYKRFLEELPDLESLFRVDDERLLKLWEGLGYYNRARNLKKAACTIMTEFDGIFPSAYEDVLSLSGIGEYTAGAICSICYDAKTPAVDGNVLRVMARLSNWNAVIDDLSTKREARQMLLCLYETGDCGTLTQALMEIGAMVCVPNGAPKCMVCPLRQLCNAYEKNTWMNLPVRKQKKKRKIEERTVFILHDEEKYGICKRPQDGLLANMWQFYNVLGKMSTSEAVSHISELGYEPDQIEKSIPYTHIFSHVEWRMTAYYIRINKRLDNLNWIDLQALQSEYALPTAFRAFIEREFTDDLS